MLTQREGAGDVKREPATRYTMRTKRKRILCRNKLQDKYSRHLSRAGNTICPSRNNINDRCIFGQDDKIKDYIDKKSNKDPHNLTAILMHLN